MPQRKRKPLAELRLEEYLRGFEDAVYLLQSHWAATVNAKLPEEDQVPLEEFDIRDAQPKLTEAFVEVSKNPGLPQELYFVLGCLYDMLEEEAAKLQKMRDERMPE